MLLAAFEPGKEMAIANFFLAIFCLFTIALPLLLITRGGKTEANRDFIAATINPWSQFNNKTELTPVIISEITPAIEIQPEIEVATENNNESVSKSDVVLSLEKNISNELDESTSQVLDPNDELLAA